MHEEGANWLTAKEAAEALGVSESTVLNDLKASRLGARDRGRGRRPRWVADPAELERVVAAGGRPDRRGGGQPQATEPVEDTELASRLRAAAQELATARAEVAALKAEVARLRMIARNANVAVSAQTDSLQQFLIELPRNG